MIAADWPTGRESACGNTATSGLDPLDGVRQRVHVGDHPTRHSPAPP